ncbi:MAG: NUDIX domain-containing protein [Rubrobacteraceae bacterium]|nr:NUDIX hydrolase [Rubrobacter sp.]
MNFPVSVKGVVLLKNERGEWELPGGRLEPGEELRECAEREIYEELNLRVKAGPLLDAYVYEVAEGRLVLIVVYGCFAGSFDGMKHSDEHRGVGFFGEREIESMNLPEGCREAVRAWREYVDFVNRSSP